MAAERVLIVGSGLCWAALRDAVDGRKRRLAERLADFAAPVRGYLAAVQCDRDIHCAPVECCPASPDASALIPTANSPRALRRT